MSPSEVKKILKKNRRVGRRPWSMYQIAQMYGCTRSMVTMTFKRPRKSRPLWSWIESVVGDGQQAAISRRKAR